MNCVRWLWFSGPLSRLMTNVVTWLKRSRTRSHHQVRQSAKQALVTTLVTA